MLLEWWERYRRFILLGGAFLFFGSSIWLYRVEQPSEKTPLPLEAPAFAAAQLPATSEPDAERMTKQAGAPLDKKNDRESPEAVLFVDVKGRVTKPGLYRFDAGMRVADAISKAGGSLPDADLEQINLAEPLADGSAVVIPAKGSDTHGTPGQLAQPLPASATRAGLGSQASSGPGINLNTATVEELTTLPGIGQARANSILTYRSEKGGFRSVEELKEIEGIGDKMFERIKDQIRIR